MGLVDQLFVRKRKSTSLPQTWAPHDRLRELCQGDADLYEAMSYALMLRPCEKESADFYLKRASDAEYRGDKVDAYANNLIAGQISLFQGRPENAKMFFSRSMKFSKNGGRVFLPLVEQTDRVLQIAKEYYRGQQRLPS